MRGGTDLSKHLLLDQHEMLLACLRDGPDKNCLHRVSLRLESENHSNPAFFLGPVRNSWENRPLRPTQNRGLEKRTLF